MILLLTPYLLTIALLIIAIIVLQCWLPADAAGCLLRLILSRPRNVNPSFSSVCEF